MEYCSFVVCCVSEPLEGDTLVICEKSVSNPKSVESSLHYVLKH